MRVGKSGIARLFLSYSLFFLLGVVGFRANWQLSAILLGTFLGLFIFSYTTVSLTPDALIMHRIGKSLELKLEEIERVQVRQHFFDKCCGTGELRIEIQGREDPIFLKGLLNPYETWKRIKIVVHLAPRNRSRSKMEGC